MKRLTIFRTIAIVCVLTIYSLTPSALNAQRNDMFFHVDNEDLYDNRADESVTLGNYGIGEPVPAGSGLLILAAAGAGYAVARRRRRGDASNASGHVMMVLACIMLLGFTQCRKQVPQVVTDNNNGFQISLSVGDGSRAVVDPTGNGGEFNWAPVKFESGDLIYVGYNGRCVGTLSCSNTEPQEYADFSGAVDITAADVVAGEHLHFYLLGGKGFNPEFNPNNTLATLNITDQTERYPVVSYAVSDDEFSMDVHTYTAPRLMNKVSILKFRVTKPANANDAICLEGLNNLVTINFDYNSNTDDGFSYSQVNYGLIKMAGVASTPSQAVDMWAIVLPQEASASGYTYNTKKTCAGVRPALNEIGSNEYLSTGVAMNLNDFAISVGTNQKVYFSPGNLQYGQNATPKWRFAEHQYTIVGNWSTTNEWVDVFGFGTWTKHVDPNNPSNNFSTEDVVWTPAHTFSLIRPLMYWSPATEYTWGNQDFVDEPNSEFYSDGYDWKTLQSGGWKYALQTRDASTLNGVDNARYAKAKVNGVQGMIVFPDTYAHPSGVTMVNAGTINVANASFTTNTYTADDWAEMEKFGAVFLPCGGLRQNNSLSNAGYLGYYYSHSNSDKRFLLISAAKVAPEEEGSGSAYNGRSVRLVRDWE